MAREEFRHALASQDALPRAAGTGLWTVLAGQHCGTGDGKSKRNAGTDLCHRGVLLDLCQEVAQALAQPLERISVEMVFGSFYHHSVAYQRGNYDDIVRFLADHAKLLGIVKRKRHKLTSEQNILIWGVAYVVTYTHASPLQRTYCL